MNFPAFSEDHELNNLVINTSDTLIIAFDQSFRFTHVNTGFCKEMQLEQHQVIGKTYYELGFPVDTCQQWDLILQRLFTEKKEFTAYSNLKQPDGKIYSFQLQLYPVAHTTASNAAALVRINDISLVENMKSVFEETTNDFIDIIQNAPDLMTIHTDEAFVYCNNKAVELLRANSKDEIIGQSIWKFIHPDYHTIGKERMHLNLLKDEPLPMIEATFICMDGSLLVLDLKSIRVHYKGKKSILFIGRDNVHLKKVEDALKRERNLLRTVINNIPDSIYIKDLDGRKLIANPQELKYMGFDKEEDAIGKTDAEIYPDQISSKFMERDRLVFETGTPVINKEELIIDKEQNEFWLSTSKVPLRNEQNKIIGLVGIGRNITQQKKLVDQLFETEQRLSKIIQSSSDWIWEVDQQGLYIYASDSIEKILGYTAAEIMGKTVFDFLSPSSRDQAVATIIEVSGNQKDIVDEETWYRHKNGEDICLLTNGFPRYDVAGNLMGYLGVGKDITHKKRKEIEITKLNQQLDTLIQSIPDAIIYKNSEGKWTIINSAAIQLFGLTDICWLGKTDEELSVLQPHLHEVHQKCIATDKITWDAGTNCYFNEIIIDYTGKEHQLNITKVPLIDDENKQMGILVICNDVTEKNRKDKALAELYDQHISLIDAIPDVITFKDGQNRWLFTNKAGRDIAGFLNWKWIGDSNLERQREIDEINKIFLNTLDEGDEQTWQSGKVSLFNKALLLPSGKKIELELRKIPLFEATGDRKSLIVISRDITKRKAEEAELKLFEAAMNNSNDAIQILEMNKEDILKSRVIYANEACCKMTGFKMEDFIGKPSRTYRNFRNDDKNKIIYNQCVQQDKPFKIEIHDLRKDGTSFWSLLSMTPIFDAQHNSNQWIAIKKDITESKEYELNIKKAMLNGQENEKYFLGRELHDNVAQMVVGVKLSLGMLKGQSENEIKWLQEAREGINDVIQELRTLSHDLSPSSFRHDHFITSIERLLKSINKENSLQIDFLFDDLEEAGLDEELKLNLYRILQEQLHNIIKHSGATVIEVSIRIIKKKIVLRVFDNGVGFDLNEVKQGIGLRNIMTRAETFSGICNINSSKGKGCELLLEIPIS